MKKYLFLITFIFSGSLIAQEYIYRANTGKPIKVNNINPIIPDPIPEPEPEPVSDCFEPSNIGKIGADGECKGKLIVNNTMLRNLVNANSDYSSTAIFTGQVTSIFKLFIGRSVIHDITGWNVSNVESMWGAFEYSDFNQDISGWNISNVEVMDLIFNHALSFNQDLSRWCVPLIMVKPSKFDYNSPLSENPAFQPTFGLLCN